MKEHNKFIQWVKAHKTELLIAGCSISAIIGIVIGVRNREELFEIWSDLREVISQKGEIPVRKPLEAVNEIPTLPVLSETVLYSQDIAGRIPFEVQKHIRNLPVGWNPSPEKLATAVENGYHLMDGQTWVATYTKGGMAA